MLFACSIFVPSASNSNSSTELHTFPTSSDTVFKISFICIILHRLPYYQFRREPVCFNRALFPFDDVEQRPRRFCAYAECRLGHDRNRRIEEFSETNVIYGNDGYIIRDGEPQVLQCL